MLYVRPPSAEECNELQRMTRQDIGRVSQRTHLILLSAQHYSVPHLVQIFGLSAHSVRFWIRRFDASGPNGLRDAPRSGRPHKLGPQAEQRLVDALRTDPATQHPTFLATMWTVAMLTLLLTKDLHLAVAGSTVRSALHRLGLRWRRPRLSMPRVVDPKKAAKQWQIAAAVVAAGPDTAVVYADESRVQTLPLVRATWQWCGQQMRVPTPGTNRALTIFGALNIRTGQWSYILRQRMQADDFILFLTYLLYVAYPQQSIILIVDNYSSHTAAKVHTWVANEPRLQLYYLPTHCAHLNPVESIWRQLKNTLAANRLYGSLELLRQTVFTFFRTMTPAAALRWAGV